MSKEQVEHREQENKTFEIRFGIHLKMKVSISDNKITELIAVNGWGDRVDPDDISIEELNVEDENKGVTIMSEDKTIYNTTEKEFKVYISGPISYLPIDQVRAAFAKAESIIKAKGHTPINPLKNGIEETRPWHVHMRQDIKMLVDCDTIYMLPDWENSKGAKLEYQIATELYLLRID